MYVNHFSHLVSYILECKKKKKSVMSGIAPLGSAWCSGLFSCGHLWSLQQVLGSQWQKEQLHWFFSYLALMSPRFLRTYRFPPYDLQQRPKPSAQVVISRWCFTEAPCFFASCFQAKSYRLEWDFPIDSNLPERTRQDSSTTRILFPSVVVIRMCAMLLFTDKNPSLPTEPIFYLKWLTNIFPRLPCS